MKSKDILTMLKLDDYFRFALNRFRNSKEDTRYSDYRKIEDLEFHATNIRCF